MDGKSVKLLRRISWHGCGPVSRCMEACHPASPNVSYLASHQPKSACFSPIDPAGPRINILKAVVTVVPRDDFGSVSLLQIYICPYHRCCFCTPDHIFPQANHGSMRHTVSCKRLVSPGRWNPARHLSIQRKWKGERSFCGGTEETC